MSDHTRTDLMTLPRYILAEQRAHKEATGDLTLLLVSIQLGCKFVATCVRKAGLVNLIGLSGEVNVQGETQKKLDVLANEIFTHSLRSSGKVAMMVSEEDENIIIVKNEDRDPKGCAYAVVFDPLDGSSNIEAGVSIGTIFGVFKLPKDGKGLLASEILRKGRDLICAGYCMYGSSTNLVMTTGRGVVNGYTLDSSIGEFILTHPNIRIPNRGKIYSINEGNAVYWDSACYEYFKGLKKRKVDGKYAPYSARYVGSMVADVHRTLLYGGIFAYPADSKSKSGKLRILYECFPMALIIENAGGKASTGTSPILDIVPESIHQRSPIFLGSADDVTDLEKAYSKHRGSSSASS